MFDNFDSIWRQAHKVMLFSLPWPPTLVEFVVGINTYHKIIYQEEKKSECLTKVRIISNMFDNCLKS